VKLDLATSHWDEHYIQHLQRRKMRWANRGGEMLRMLARVNIHVSIREQAGRAYDRIRVGIDHLEERIQDARLHGVVGNKRGNNNSRACRTRALHPIPVFRNLRPRFKLFPERFDDEEH
jgi:hypothetical protein